MIKHIIKSDSYFKISFIFLLYTLLLFNYKENDLVFILFSIILFLLILYFIYLERIKNWLLYKACNSLHLIINNKHKEHNDFNSILDTLKIIEDDIIKKNSSIDLLGKSRSKFLGNVSHELKTPLFIIKGFIDTLLDGAISDNSVNIEFLYKIKKQTDRLDFLLSDLMKISMIESDELKLDLQILDLDDILNELNSSFSNILINRGDKFIIPDKTDIKVKVDKENMLCVFNNLINNAINYSLKGDIILSVKQNQKHAKIKLIDHGIGISDEHLDKIFERFYRVDSDRSRGSGGTGLGLAIVEDIINSHGGNIQLSKSKFNGLQVKIFLPF